MDFIKMVTSFVLGGGLVTLLLTWGLPNIIQKYIQGKIDRKLDILRIEQEKELQKEIEDIKYNNSLALAELNNNFKNEYQKLEHHFSVKMETLKKEFDVLPVVYEKVVRAESFYKNNYHGQKLNSVALQPFADLKNYLTLNKFYINEEVYVLAKECEKTVFKMAMAKKKSKDVNLMITEMQFNEEMFDNYSKILDSHIDDLEGAIRRVLKS